MLGEADLAGQMLAAIAAITVMMSGLEAMRGCFDEARDMLARARATRCRCARGAGR